jgi:hypothetical protein
MIGCCIPNLPSRGCNIAVTYRKRVSENEALAALLRVLILLYAECDRRRNLIIPDKRGCPNLGAMTRNKRYKTTTLVADLPTRR